MLRYLMVLCFFVCTQLLASPSGHEIKIKVKGYEAGMVKLGYHFGNQQYLQDSTYINQKGIATFKGEEALKSGIYFAILPDKQYFEFLVHEQFFTLKSDKGDLGGAMKAENSLENKLFFENLKETKSVEKLLGEKNAQLQKLRANSPEKEALSKEIEQIKKTNRSRLDALIQQHSDTYFAALMRASSDPIIPDELVGTDKTLETKRYQFFRKAYFEGYDFNDGRIARSPILNNRMTYFLEKLTIQEPDSLIKACDYLIGMTEEADTNHYKFVLTSLLNKYAKSKIMGQDAVYVHIAKKYYTKEKAWWVNFADLYRITDRAAKMEPTLIGKKAKDIRLKDWDGNYRRLYDIQTPYIALYFWDPDCGHCKKMTPKLVDFLTEYKEKGVTVMSITVEKEEEKWREYISKNELDKLEGWINMGDFEFRSRFREDYDLTGTPRLFLLDENRQIKAKRINPEQLGNVLEMVIKQKEAATEKGN